MGYIRDCRAERSGKDILIPHLLQRCAVSWNLRNSTSAIHRKEAPHKACFFRVPMGFSGPQLTTVGDALSVGLKGILRKRGTRPTRRAR